MQNFFREFVIVLMWISILSTNINAKEFWGLTKAVTTSTDTNIISEEEYDAIEISKTSYETDITTYYYEGEDEDDYGLREDFKVYYDYTPETNEEKLDAKKLELLYKLRIKLIKILNTKKDLSLENIEDQKTKTIYTNKLNAIVSNIEDKYSYNNYWYNWAWDYFIKDLKEDIKSFKIILKELEYIESTWKSPYNISLLINLM